MKRKMLFTLALVVALVALFAISASAAAPLPSKPDLGVDFGSVTTISGFTPPSQQFVNTTQRVLLVDGDGNYVTYPAYYITKDSTTFDVNFNNLNTATGITYSKASIVMLEVPAGITTISNSYFSGTGFAKCVSVQIPGTVTTYGTSMFSTNTVIRCVEFLDGTTPVTMGDSMFGSNWSVGTTNLEYVKFPNNLTSIGKSTFGKSHANKTIILGEKLASIGTAFFGESTPDSKDTFIYASNNFFKNTDMFEKLFGGYDQYHNSLMKITIFYVGSQTEAQAFVDKGVAVATGYIFSNAKLVSASAYDYATDKPGRNSLTMVYDYNACDAFYYGMHDGEDYDCTTANVCVNCGKSSPKEADTHNLVEKLAYVNGFDNAGAYSYYCDRVGCTMAGKEIRGEERGAIVTFKGYSIPETQGVKGINAGFKIDKVLLADYNEINKDGASLTLFMVNSAKLEKILDGETLELASGVKGINVKITSTNYTDIGVEVRGFDNSSDEGNYYTLNLITAIAVKTGDGIHYVQAGLKTVANTTQSVGGVIFNTVSADKVYSAVAK